MRSGIYKILNVITKKIYVGSSIDIQDRWYFHKNSLSNGTHHSIKLQRSYNIHGVNNFNYEIIEECDLDSLIIREQFYIDFFNSYKNGYNSRPKAENNLGVKHSDKSKNLIRLASYGNKNMLGKHHNEETKQRISEKLINKSFSDETKLKMSNSQKGRKHNEETKQKLREQRIRKPLSEEHKKKLSEAKLGKKQSLETIQKRVKANTGKKRTKDTKQRISDKLKGIIRGPMSDEHKSKIQRNRLINQQIKNK